MSSPVASYALIALGVLLLLAAVFWWFKPEPRIMVLAGLPVLFGLGFGMVHILKQQKAQAHIQAFAENGLHGEARILRADSTNVTVGRRHEVLLTLEVTLPGRPAYSLETRQLIPIGQAATPDRRLRVSVAPDDLENILIDWAQAPGPQAQPAAGELEKRLQALSDLHDKGLISESEYREQRARLLSEL